MELKPSQEVLVPDAFKEFHVTNIAPRTCAVLSQSEANVNQVLEQLPGFNITGKKLRVGESLLFAFSIVVVQLLLCTSMHWVKFLFPNFLSTPWEGLGFSVAVLTSMIFIHIKAIKHLSKNLPNTSKKEVHKTKLILEAAIKRTSSPMLKGRLAEMYFLRDNDNIDHKFWKKVNKVVGSFVKEETRDDPVSEELFILRNNYRQMVLHPKETRGESK